ncbi:MAG: hypothetical protein GXP25_15160 [Planctomycetes bacterium]|nr:hypothetical protein [Planctomycetota bacterium]
MKRMLAGLILAGAMLTSGATADAAVLIVKPRPKPRTVIVKPTRRPKPRKIVVRPKPKTRSLINIDIDF